MTAPLLQHFDLLATAPGGVARLRELILTLAVQGKLVPQDPSDEHASVLLQRIRAEKDRLIAEGKIKRDKPLPPITGEEKPLELPKGWEWVRLGSVFSLEYGASLPDKVRVPGTCPVYGSNGVVGSHVEALVPSPSLIVGRKGSVGAINVATEPFWPIDTSYFVTPPTGIDLNYAFNLFLSLNLGKHDKSTAIPGINRNDVYCEVIAIPPQNEQTRIVARVEELMSLCDGLEAKRQLDAAQHAQLLQTLLGTLTDSATPEELAANWQRVATNFDLLLDSPEAVDALEQTILQLAVRGLLVQQDPTDEPASGLLQRIRTEKDRLIAEGKIKRDKPLPPIAEEEKPFELPLGWEWARLGSLANFIDYRGKTPVKTEAGVPLITAKNVRQGFINREPREFIAESAYDGWMTRGFPRVGDLLFTTEAPLGNIAAIDIHERFALAQRVICFGIYELGMSGALCAFIQSPWMQDALAMQASGVTAQGIKSARLQLMPIPVPPLPEQSRIVARVAELRQLCADLRQRLIASQTTQCHLGEALVDCV